MLLLRFLAPIAVLSLCLIAGFLPATLAEDEVFGPPNMLKTSPTPFGPVIQASNSEPPPENTLTLPTSSTSRLHSLGHRLVANTRVYLPGRLVIGKPAEFVIKGRPGSQVAIAMADKNSGCKPIYGQTLRLGPDRKLVSLGTIPDTGVLSLAIDTPIQGDLIGEHLYFETAVWSKPDFSDLEIASPVKSEITDHEKDFINGVIISPEADQKRGVRFVPEAGIPLYQRNKAGTPSLDSGRP